MNKKLIYPVLTAVLFASITALQTGCANSPAGPSATPTPVPTVSVSGSITLPAPQAGHAIWVAFYSSLADLSKPDNSFTGVCSANPMPYSLTVSAGSYYIVSVVDVDNNSMFLSPNAGDYTGVYGTAWPAWPASKNAAVSALNSTFDLTLVTATNNISGNITIPADQAGKQFWIFLDQDTNGGNTNYTAVQVSTCPAGTSIPYAMVALIPGNYYLYGGVNCDNSGGAPNSGDYIGFFGSPGPFDYIPPSGPNVAISIDTPIVKNFSEQVYP